MTEDDAIAWFATNVSRETREQLTIYAGLLRKWQGTINLVAPSTLDAIWSRHMLDSHQVFALRHVQAGHWLDLGSGGGFPGLVCAMSARSDAPDLRFTFIESDIRKCSFLREVGRATGLSINVLTRRVEDAPPQRADIVSARAVAGLPQLCNLAEPHLLPTGICLFQKGKSHKAEAAEADEKWLMKREIFPSMTDPEAVIYRIGDLARV